MSFTIRESLSKEDCSKSFSSRISVVLVRLPLSLPLPPVSFTAETKFSHHGRDAKGKTHRAKEETKNIGIVLWKGKDPIGKKKKKEHEKKDEAETKEEKRLAVHCGKKDE